MRARFDPRIDSYSYHCGMAPMLFATLDIRRDDYDFALATKMIDVWRRAAPLLLYGDYYPHTPFHRSAKEWVVWQFDDPTAGQGLSRASVCPPPLQESTTVHLQGIDADAQYRFENMESGETREVAGDSADS